MGILQSTEENQQEYDPDVGYVPKRLLRPEILSNEQKIVHVIGDGKLLTFDKKTWTFEQVKVSEESFECSQPAT